MVLVSLRPTWSTFSNASGGLGTWWGASAGPGSAYTGSRRLFGTTGDVSTSRARRATARRSPCIFHWPAPLRDNESMGARAARTEDVHKHRAHWAVQARAGMSSSSMRLYAPMANAGDHDE